MDGKDGELTPRPLREVLHSAGVGVAIAFDSLRIGSRGPMANDGVSQAALKCLFAVVEEISGYFWLKVGVACTVAAAMEVLLRCFAANRVPQVWVSGTAAHFENQALRLVAEALGVSHHFTFANPLGLRVRWTA